MRDARIEEAQARAGASINLTCADVHHAAIFNRLQKQGCEWSDILDAIDKVTAAFAAKGRTFRSWSVIEEHAIAMRDLRLKPEAQPYVIAPTAAALQRSVWDRVVAEVEGAFGPGQEAAF